MARKYKSETTEDLETFRDSLLDNSLSKRPEEMTFGEVLKSTRIKNGMSQFDMSIFLGVSQGSIMRWEREDGGPPVDRAQYILKRLGYEMIIRKVEKDDGSNMGNRL